MEKIAICRFYLLNKLILNILKISLVVFTGIENKDKKKRNQTSFRQRRGVFAEYKKKKKRLFLL